MSLPGIMAWIETLPFSVAIAESSLLFPIIETVHVLALVVVVGSVAMIDVRLLYLGSRQRAVSELTSNVLRWTWVAFAVAAVAGALMFCSNATMYYRNLPFQVKLVCIVLAGANMLTFHVITARGIAHWDRGPPPWPVRLAGALSLTLWTAVVAAGRWIGFT